MISLRLMSDRRQRVHELVLALLAAQNKVELLDADAAVAVSDKATGSRDPGGWLERNRRVLQLYQAVVRSAVTLDALIDQEVEGQRLTDS
jgi:hypothetical protein